LCGGALVGTSSTPLSLCSDFFFCFLLFLSGFERLLFGS
jgi:hypothetical protein